MNTESRLAMALLFTAVPSLPLALADTGPVSIQIRAGNIDVMAAGEDARATVNFGGFSSSDKETCPWMDIRTGNIRKIAIGRNARANVDISESHPHCQENQP